MKKIHLVFLLTFFFSCNVSLSNQTDEYRCNSICCGCNHLDWSPKSSQAQKIPEKILNYAIASVPVARFVRPIFNAAKKFFFGSSKSKTCACSDKDLCKVKRMSRSDIRNLSDKLQQFNACFLYGGQSSFEENWHKLGLDRLSPGAQKELRKRLEQERCKRKVSFSTARSNPNASIFDNRKPEQAVSFNQSKSGQKDAVRQNFINSKKEIEKYELGLCKKNQKRAHAIRKAIENSFRTTFHRYELSSCAIQLLKENKIELAQFQECVGNDIQQQIHQEFVDVLNDGAALYSYQDVNDLTDRWYGVLSDASSVGCTVNNVGHYVLAHNIADICEGLYFIEDARASFFVDSEVEPVSVEKLWDAAAYQVLEAWQKGAESVAGYGEDVLQKAAWPIRWVTEFTNALQRNPEAVYAAAERLLLNTVECSLDSIRAVEGISENPFSQDTKEKVALVEQKWIYPLREKVLYAADVFWQMPFKEKTQELLAAGLQVVFIVGAAKMAAALPACVAVGKAAVLLHLDKLSQFSGPVFRAGISSGGQAIISLEQAASASPALVAEAESAISVVTTVESTLACPAAVDAICHFALVSKKGVLSAVGSGGPNLRRSSYGRKTKVAREKARKVRKRNISPPDDIVKEYRCFIGKKVEWSGSYNMAEIQSQYLPKKLTFTEKTLDHIFFGKVEKLPRNGPLKTSGYHSDFKGRALKRSGMKISKTRDAKTGAFDAKIGIFGKRSGKTMFPDNWRPAEVLEGADEALKNVFEIILQKNGRILYLGRSCNGMVIEVIAEKTGEIVTFYPRIF